MTTAQVIRTRLLDMQVCVPTDWTDEQVKTFADTENVAGTSGGWFIRKQGHKRLNGCDERVKCVEREGFVHIILEC